MSSNEVILLVTLASFVVGLVWMGVDRLRVKLLSPAQRWALAASGNLAATWNDRFDRLRLPIPPAEARQMLLQWWNVHSAAEAVETLDWLWNEGHSAEFRVFHRELSRLPKGQLESWLDGRPQEERNRLFWLHLNLGAFRDGDLVSWDMERQINLARGVYTAGWIDKATAWRYMMVAARRLQAAYGSWHEMSDNYLAGRLWWEEDEVSNPRYREAANRLLTSWSSPWIKIPWSTPLT